MPRPVLHDAVSLCHFATIGRLDILEDRHAHLNEPRWCETVKGEVEDGANIGIVANQAVLRAAWLGTPMDIDPADHLAAYRLHVALNEGKEPPTMHEGEAHSIFLAEKMDAVFMTDDNAAFDFAMRRFNLGPGRVKDTVDVLRDSVAMGFITKEIAAATAESMEERDRALRVVHRGKITPNYFM